VPLDALPHEQAIGEVECLWGKFGSALEFPCPLILSRRMTAVLASQVRLGAPLQLASFPALVMRFGSRLVPVFALVVWLVTRRQLALVRETQIPSDAFVRGSR
jgi:hypothetical protein